MQSKLASLNKLQEKGDSSIGGLLAFVKNEIDQAMRKVGDMQSKLPFLMELQTKTNEFEMFKALDTACEKAAATGDTLWSLALASLKPKLPTSKEWSTQFSQIQNKQVFALRMMTAILRPEKLGLCFRTWSDISRAANSALGSNITDMQFFAVAPKLIAPKLASDSVVTFPCVRPSNFTDEVDIRTPASFVFKAKNRDGNVVKTNLQKFMKNIGQFIGDLPRKADWSDPIDTKVTQASAQFSVLPAPYGCVDIGVAAFGYQHKNLHIIVGPNGNIGWVSARVMIVSTCNHIPTRRHISIRAGLCVVGEEATMVGCDGTKSLSVRACPSLSGAGDVRQPKNFFPRPENQRTQDRGPDCREPNRGS